MFYAFGKYSPGWKSQRKKTLFTRLTALINKFTVEEAEMPEENAPYVELTPQTDVVAIRRITHLSDDLREKLTSQADQVYREVMGLPRGKSALRQQSIGKARTKGKSLVSSEQTRMPARVPSK